MNPVGPVLSDSRTRPKMAGQYPTPDRVGSHFPTTVEFRSLEGGSGEQDETSARKDERRRGGTRREKTRGDKTRQDKTRQDKTRQDKTRGDKTRERKDTTEIQRDGTNQHRMQRLHETKQEETSMTIMRHSSQTSPCNNNTAQSRAGCRTGTGILL